MSDHIRTVEPHAHEWTVVYQTEACRLLECVLCGSRRHTGHDPFFKAPPAPAPWLERWLDGGPLPEGIGR